MPSSLNKQQLLKVVGPNRLAQVKLYWGLMRFHRPIGLWLLLWPTWWALWLAAEGVPDMHLLVIFTLGVVVMRAAGCVINDIHDRDIDQHVARTAGRPLTSGHLSVKQAYCAFFSLLAFAFVLVLFTHRLTLYLSLGAVVLAAIYPLMKRLTYLPQVVLGAAFSMSIPMAFAAQAEILPPQVILLYASNLLWVVVYDTFYGMADREHDKPLGLKSTAILFEGNDHLMTGGLQFMVLLGFYLVGQRFTLGLFYYSSLLVVAALMLYQQWLIHQKQPSSYFAAFHHNHWVGLTLFMGIALHYAFST